MPMLPVPRRTLLLLTAAAVTLAACKDKGGEDSGDSTATAPTYWADIAPLYRDRCVDCHQSGGLGPMALDNYADAATWATASAASTAARAMPPWGVEGHSVEEGLARAEGALDPASCDNDYVDALWLSDEEIALITAWAEAGAPEGEAVTLDPPASRSLDEARVQALSTPTFLPEATTEEGGEYDEYRCFVVDPGWTEDAWLTGYEVVPGNDAIVHHVIGMPVDPERMGSGGMTNGEWIAALDGADGRPGWTCYSQAGEAIAVEGEYTAWAPGQGVVHYPEGSGLEVNAGELMVVQIHYNMVSTSNATDATTLRLELADSVARPGYLVLLDGWRNQVLSAGDPAATVQWRFGQNTVVNYLGIDNVVIEGVMPHMHELGVQETMEVGPEDETTCTTGVRAWDFGWQRIYFYEEPVPMVPGDMIRVTCTYDLSGVDHDVTWGWGTQDEMCLMGLYITEGDGT